MQHRDTLMALSCQKDHVEPTDFGAEFEVSTCVFANGGGGLEEGGERNFLGAWDGPLCLPLGRVGKEIMFLSGSVEKEGGGGGIL